MSTDNNCWYHLTIDTSNAFKSDWEFTCGNNNPNKVDFKIIDATSVFTSEWLEYMKSINFPVDFVSLFYKPSLYPYSYKAHVDLRDDHAPMSYALNWVIGGEDSEMIWYNLPDKDSLPDNESLIHHIPETGAPAKKYKTDTLTEIDRCKIKYNITLVRVDVPHSISSSLQSRKCISARDGSNYKSWHEVVEHLHSLNLLIDRI